MPENYSGLDTIDTEETRPGDDQRALVGLTLLYHPDVRRIGEVAPLFSLPLGGKHRVSRMEPPFFASGSHSGKPLATPVVSRTPLTIRTDSTGTIVLDAADTEGAVWVDGEQVTGERRVAPTNLAVGVLIELSRSVLVLLHLVEASPKKAHGPASALLGESRGIHRVREEIQRVSQVTNPVLVRGPSGSGKELVAEAIHRCSSRASKPYVTVNMAALHGDTAMAALFGHSRGAFTGASHSSTGYFGAAEGGTLLLDEIGEVPRELQGSLLRAIREGEIQPLGEPRTRTVDVRVISATDADLEVLVEAGRFALPLLRRLDGLVIELPPLWQRRDDIARLFLHFLERELLAVGHAAYLREPEPGGKPWLSLRVLTAILGYAWPGNVAELQGVVTRLVLDNLGRERCQLSDALAHRLGRRSSSAPPATTAGAVAKGASTPPDVPAQRRDAQTVTDSEIASAMRAAAFRVKIAAEQLGVSRSWLNTRLEHCEGVRKAKQLDQAEIEAAGQRHAWDIAQMAAALEVSEHGLKLRMQPFKPVS
jgi:two-component system, NtrC family, nitrogen regulation response regulator GlnG